LMRKSWTRRSNCVTATIKMTNELVIVTNVVSREISGLDVVNSVNGFYSGAFDKLFQLVLALIALFGIIIPILVQIYQRRVMKVSEAELKAEMERLLEVKKIELLAVVEKQLASEKKEISSALEENTKLIKKTFLTAEGYAFHLQGNSEVASKNHYDACVSFCKAARNYTKSGGNFTDLTRVCNVIANTVLPMLTKKDLEKGDLDGRIDELLKHLKETEDTHLTDTISNLSEAFRATRKREVLGK